MITHTEQKAKPAPYRSTSRPSDNDIRITTMSGMIPFLLAIILASPFSGSGSGPTLVSAHGGLANYTVGDVWYPG